MVARDGIEPPTPAFQGGLPSRVSGLKSTHLIEFNRLTPAGLQADVGSFGLFSAPRCTRIVRAQANSGKLL